MSHLVLRRRNTVASDVNSPVLPSGARVTRLTEGMVPVLGPVMWAGYHGTSDDEGETPEEMTAALEGALTGDYGPVFDAGSLCVSVDDSPVAGIVCGLEPAPGSSSPEPFVITVFTSPRYQHRGLARALLLTVLAAAGRAGYEYTHLWVSAGNTPALSLYRSLGFETHVLSPESS